MEPAEIVKELAIRDPRDVNGVCRLCGRRTSAAFASRKEGSETLESPDIVTKHDETCPYRLAKNWLDANAA